MRHPPPLYLLAGLDDVVGLVVVAGHDRHGLGQRPDPVGDPLRVVVPQIDLGVAPQRREGEGGVGARDGFAETLASLVRPVDVARAVECEVAETLVDEVLGAHLPCQSVGAGDVRDGGETLLEILRHGQDAVLAEEVHVVRVVELADDGVHLHPAGPFDHLLYAVLVADRQGEAVEAPCFARGLGEAGDPVQQVPGVLFRKIGQENHACHVWVVFVRASKGSAFFVT